MAARPADIGGAGASAHGRGLAIALGAVLLISFDALMVRLADAPHWDIVFWRGWLICLSLGAWMVVTGTPLKLPSGRRERWLIMASVVLLSGNTTLFVLSVTYTAVANTVVILAASPFFAALFSRIFLHEAVPLRTWAAIALSVLGVVVVFGGGLQGGSVLGDSLALLLAMTVGAQLTILRRFPAVARLPLVCVSGAIAGAMAIPFSDPFSLSLSSYTVIGIMGILQMPLATVLLTVATRYLPSPEVSLCLLIETILGPIWVWWLLGEAVPSLTLVGGALILTTVAVHATLALRAERQTRLA
ncbi:DMT family transporter [Spiribacter onubensis]|uniref:DMT family transporter n=1 Tax=Spiribacter onubensis TaxID=3122420 RepID=A0ABV3SBE3_9GAMM